MKRFLKLKKSGTTRGVYCSSPYGIGMCMKPTRHLDGDSTDVLSDHKLSDYQWTPSTSEDHHVHSPLYSVTSSNIELLRAKETELRGSGALKSLDSSEEKYEDEIKKQKSILLRSIVKERVNLVPIGKRHYALISNHHNLISSTHILINKERAARGILPLCRQKELDDLACEQAKRIATQGGKEHSNVNDLISRLTKIITVPIRRIGENVCGGVDMDSIYQKMMNDPRYLADRNNMFDRRFISYGVGVAQSSKGKYYVCQLYRG